MIDASREFHFVRIAIVLAVLVQYSDETMHAAEK